MFKEIDVNFFMNKPLMFMHKNSGKLYHSFVKEDFKYLSMSGYVYYLEDLESTILTIQLGDKQYLLIAEGYEGVGNIMFMEYSDAKSDA